MKSSVFTRVIIIILLFINIASLLFIWTHKPHPEQPPRDRQPDAASFLIHELKLNKEQQQKYEKLVSEHHSSVEKINESDHSFHKLFFDLLQGNHPDTLKANQIADSIGNNKKKMEMLTFNHFLELKSLCNEEQKKKFDDVIMEALRIMNPRPPKN